MVRESPYRRLSETGEYKSFRIAIGAIGVLFLPRYLWTFKRRESTVICFYSGEVVIAVGGVT
jgi:hypothetical protein